MNHLYQKGKIVFQVINGTIIVIVILEKGKCLYQYTGYILCLPLLLSNQLREKVSNGICYIQVVNQYIIQDIPKPIVMMAWFYMMNMMPYFIANDLMWLH